MMNEMIQKVTEGNDLTFNEMTDVMDAIMTGQTTPVQIAALLSALATKGETVDEIAAAAASMRKHAAEFEHQPAGLDIVGTGGDHSNSFNISTTTGLVVASLGVSVVKHGNRAASSKSGAADVIEALGLPLDLSAENGAQELAKHHFTFLFAQKYHPAMRYVAPVRKELGIRTIFNILGPLANPAHVGYQVLGVYDPDLMEPLAKVLDKIGVKRANVIYGTDGLDEASISAPTKIVTLDHGNITATEITPEQFGLTRATKEAIVGGTPADNAAITHAILDGQTGAKRDVVLLNAGIALNAVDPDISIEKGIQLAADAIDSGKANQLLQTLNKEEA